MSSASFQKNMFASHAGHNEEGIGQMCKKIVMKIWMYVRLCSRSPGLMDLCDTKFKDEVETDAYFEHPKSLCAHTLLTPEILLKV